MPNQYVLLRCPACRTLNRVPADKLSAHPICGKCRTGLEYPHSPVNATAQTFDHEVFDWPEYVLVDFWADTAG